jgi:hypothetical protein
MAPRKIAIGERIQSESALQEIKPHLYSLRRSRNFRGTLNDHKASVSLPRTHMKPDICDLPDTAYLI